MSTFKVLITGAGGRIAYSLIPLICRGDVFRKSTKISLRLLDIEAAKSILEGLKLEIEDANYDLVQDVLATTSFIDACKDVDFAILLGGFPRLPGMERKDLISKNAKGIKEQAEGIDMYASSNCKVLVVANPANTNCLVAIHTAKRIPARNFSCLTRLDEERLRSFCCHELNESGHFSDSILPSQIHHVSIFGNHSTTQVPYIGSGVYEDNKHQFHAIEPHIKDFPTMIKKVQNRGAEIIATLKASSAMSCAIAIEKHIQDWCRIPNPRINPTSTTTAHTQSPSTTHSFSMGILSDGNMYDIPAGLVFSFPCYYNEESQAIEIVPNLVLDASTRSLLQKTVTELLEEKEVAKEYFVDTI